MSFIDVRVCIKTRRPSSSRPVPLDSDIEERDAIWAENIATRLAHPHTCSDERASSPMHNICLHCTRESMVRS